MTRYSILLADESTASIDADELQVVDGALCFLVADAVPPAPLRRVFVLSARAWRWCTAGDAGVSFSNAAWGGEKASAPAPKVLPAISTPDPMRRSAW
jgi:hypothetical protein